MSVFSSTVKHLLNHLNLIFVDFVTKYLSARFSPTFPGTLIKRNLLYDKSDKSVSFMVALHL